MMLDWETLVTYLPILMKGAMTTVELTVLIIIFGFVIAVPVALARNSRSRAARIFAQSFIFFFRGAPILAVLFLLYYGLPQIPGIKDSVLWYLIERPMPIAVLALSLNSAGFLAEIFAIALRNISIGEIEAARAFGFSKAQTFFRFTIPGAARLCIRSYGNELVFVLKGTAAVNFITITDLIGAANQVYFNTFDPFTPLLIAGAIYLLFALLIVTGIRLVEQKLSPWLHAETTRSSFKEASFNET
jgi:His/Glu/Gln/Arg/opine family amino acid ABC transporter permease subunit